MRKICAILGLYLFLPALVQADDFKVGDLYYSIVSEKDKTVSVENGNKKRVGVAPGSPAKDIVVSVLPQSGEVALGSGYEEYEGNYCEGDIVVPSAIEYDGETYTVTELANGAFSNCYGITSVSLPETIVAIGPGAFYSCVKLQELVLPNSVETIGVDVLFSCTALQRVSWSSSAPVIPEGAFSKYVFGTFSADELIVENVDNVTEIKDNAFNDTNIRHYPSWKRLRNIGESAFSGSLLEEVAIPEGCIVSKTAFNNCSHLTTLELPTDCPENISEYFESCNSIKVIRMAAIIPPALNSDWAQNVAAGCVLEVPEESVELYRAAEYWKEFRDIRSSGVDSVMTDGLLVDGSAGRLRVRCSAGVEVFDMWGAQLYAGTATDLLVPTGIYVVRTANQVVKVYVK